MMAAVSLSTGNSVDATGSSNKAPEITEKSSIAMICDNSSLCMFSIFVCNFSETKSALVPEC
jgi:hypothetical protein